MRENLTLLDNSCFTAKNLPSELFLDYDFWVLPLAKQVNIYKGLDQSQKLTNKIKGQINY